MHLFPRKNWNPATTDEESEKKGNNQVRSRSVSVSDYLPDNGVSLLSIHVAYEKLIILFLEASNNDLVIIFPVPKKRREVYPFVSRSWLNNHVFFYYRKQLRMNPRLVTA
jgi:hypothetical protein